MAPKSKMQLKNQHSSNTRWKKSEEIQDDETNHVQAKHVNPDIAISFKDLTIEELDWVQFLVLSFKDLTIEELDWVLLYKETFFLLDQPFISIRKK